VRSGRHYGLRWFELPAAFVTAVLVHLMEIGGMRSAFAEGGPGAERSQAMETATVAPAEPHPAERVARPGANL
jgi:hypothetical protein